MKKIFVLFVAICSVFIFVAYSLVVAERDAALAKEQSAIPLISADSISIPEDTVAPQQSTPKSVPSISVPTVQYHSTPTYDYTVTPSSVTTPTYNYTPPTTYYYDSSSDPANCHVSLSC